MFVCVWAWYVWCLLVRTEEGLCIWFSKNIIFSHTIDTSNFPQFFFFGMYGYCKLGVILWTCYVVCHWWIMDTTTWPRFQIPFTCVTTFCWELIFLHENIRFSKVCLTWRMSGSHIYVRKIHVEISYFYVQISVSFSIMLVCTLDFLLYFENFGDAFRFMASSNTFQTTH